MALTDNLEFIVEFFCERARCVKGFVVKLNHHLQADNEPLKKYALCMMMRSELMTKDGKFKKDVAMAKIPNAG